MASSVLLSQESDFSATMWKEKLHFPDLKFPDITLDADRCHPLCLVSHDHRSLTFRRGRPADVSSAMSRYEFLGTCGTQSLSGKAYWQVRIRINKPKEFLCKPLYVLAEIGLATQDCLQVSRGIFSTKCEVRSFSVKLCTNGKCLLATTNGGINACDMEFLTGLGEMDGRIGFLLDIFLGELIVLDATTRRVLFVCSKKLREDLYPVVNLVQNPAVNDAEVCLTVESGWTLALLKEVADILSN